MPHRSTRRIYHAIFSARPAKCRSRGASNFGSCCFEITRLFVDTFLREWTKHPVRKVKCPLPIVPGDPMIASPAHIAERLANTRRAVAFRELSSGESLLSEELPYRRSGPACKPFPLRVEPWFVEPLHEQRPWQLSLQAEGAGRTSWPVRCQCTLRTPCSTSEGSSSPRSKHSLQSRAWRADIRRRPSGWPRIRQNARPEQRREARLCRDAKIQSRCCVSRQSP